MSKMLDIAISIDRYFKSHEEDLNILENFITTDAFFSHPFAKKAADAIGIDVELLLILTWHERWPKRINKIFGILDKYFESHDTTFVTFSLIDDTDTFLHHRTAKKVASTLGISVELLLVLTEHFHCYPPDDICIRYERAKMPLTSDPEFDILIDDGPYYEDPKIFLIGPRSRVNITDLFSIDEKNKLINKVLNYANIVPTKKTVWQEKGLFCRYTRSRASNVQQPLAWTDPNSSIVNHLILKSDDGLQQDKALCGTKPGKKSTWSYHDEAKVTCPKCKKLETLLNKKAKN